MVWCYALVVERARKWCQNGVAVGKKGRFVVFIGSLMKDSRSAVESRALQLNNSNSHTALSGRSKQLYRERANNKINDVNDDNKGWREVSGWKRKVFLFQKCQVVLESEIQRVGAGGPRPVPPPGMCASRFCGGQVWILRGACRGRAWCGHRSDSGWVGERQTTHRR